MSKRRFPVPVNCNNVIVLAVLLITSDLNTLDFIVPLTSNVVAGEAVPIPNLPFVLSQNKLALSCTTFPVPSNKTRPTVPEVIAVVPIVMPEGGTGIASMSY